MGFIVCGYPRSRTKWFSEFLTYGNSKCLHEPVFDKQSDLITFLKSQNGVSDSHLIMSWAELLNQISDLKILLVRRPKHEVKASLNRIGLELSADVMDLVEINIAELSKVKSAYVVDYKQIDYFHKDIFKYIHGIECPSCQSYLIEHNIQLSKEEINIIRNKLINEECQCQQPGQE